MILSYGCNKLYQVYEGPDTGIPTFNFSQIDNKKINAIKPEKINENNTGLCGSDSDDRILEFLIPKNKKPTGIYYRSIWQREKMTYHESGNKIQVCFGTFDQIGTDLNNVNLIIDDKKK